MTRNIISDAVGNISDRHIEEMASFEYRKQKPRLRLVAAAARLCVCAVAVATILIMNAVNGGQPSIPIVNLQSPSDAPRYYGNTFSIGGSPPADTASEGISVIAEFVEMLPDTYTFFNDWRQSEVKLLRLKTVKLIKGAEMTDEFYYMIPVDYVTDYSVYHNFFITDMAQYGCEKHIMYNKTKGQAECLSLVLFGYSNYNFNFMHENFMAYDVDGNCDTRLWQSCDAWKETSESGEFSKYVPKTIKEAEENEKKTYNEYTGNLQVQLLNSITGEAKTVLDEITSFENGIFVRDLSGYLLSSYSSIQFHATRYINGFPTNERVSIRGKEWSNTGEATYLFSSARFDEDDLNALPDLASAMSSVVNAYEAGTITPPHIEGYSDMELRNYGIFGWYAKSESGVLGIVRVTWHYMDDSNDRLYDDAYYFIEYGADEYKPILRDDLLEWIGEYEKTYIYEGGYNEKGKSDVILMPPV